MITADFVYIRWLGARKGIKSQTLIWDKSIVDRTPEMSEWVKYCYPIVRRGLKVFGYANNHYGGHAPDTVEQFRKLWKAASGGDEISQPTARPTPTPKPPQQQGSLFS